MWELPLERWERDAAREPDVRRSSRRAASSARSRERATARSSSSARPPGSFGEAGHADYAAAKAALVGLLLSLKNEVVRVAPLARVNAVFPGWTESPMTRGYVDPEQVRRVSRTMALRKVAQPEDVARQIVVLASDELSGHVTGQVSRSPAAWRAASSTTSLKSRRRPRRAAADETRRRRANCR